MYFKRLWALSVLILFISSASAYAGMVTESDVVSLDIGGLIMRPKILLL